MAEVKASPFNYGEYLMISNLKKQKQLFILSGLAIPMILLIAFVIIPGFDLFRISLTSWDGMSPDTKFIGLSNYKSMFSNTDLWLSLKNNMIYFVIHLLMIPLELAFAVLLNSKLKAAKVYKTFVFMPYIINGVAISYAFSYFFSPINGAMDALLNLFGLGFLSQQWLSDPKVVNFVLAFVSLWRFCGYHIILFLAALQSMPKDIEEAALIDGATSWQLFKYIQIPSIMMIVDFVLFDNIRGALQVFDIPFVMTNGGPGYASSTFTLFTINTAFKFSNFGLASTMAVAIMVMIIIIYIIQNYVIHKLLLKEN